MSQLILQPFRRFTYVTAHSPTLPLLHLRHRLFTYDTWRTAHGLSNYWQRKYLNQNQTLQLKGEHQNTGGLQFCFCSNDIAYLYFFIWTRPPGIMNAAHTLLLLHKCKPEVAKNNSRRTMCSHYTLNFLLPSVMLHECSTVLVIGGGSPMNESDPLVTLLPPGTSGSTANWFLTQ